MRVKELAMRTGGIFDEICSPDWARSFEPIHRLSFGYRWDVLLSQAPNMNVRPEPILVEIDGVPYPQYGAFGDRRWSYDSRLNAIRFEPLAVPEPGSTVTVTCVPACG